MFSEHMGEDFPPKEPLSNSLETNDEVFAASKPIKMRVVEEEEDKKEGFQIRRVNSKFTREDLVKMGREKLAAWKSDSKTALNTLNLKISHQIHKIANKEKAAREVLEATVAELKREIRHLSREKAEYQFEVQKLLGVTNNLQDGMSRQQDLVHQMKKEYAELLEEKKKVEGELKSALAEASNVREMLTERDRIKATVAASGKPISSSVVSAPRVDLTEILKQTSKETSSASSLTTSASSRLQQLTVLSEGLLATLINAQTQMSTQKSLPPTPSGEIPGVVSTLPLHQQQRLYNSVISPESSSIMETLIAKSRAIHELLSRAEKEVTSADANVQKANRTVSPGNVYRVLIRKARGNKDLGIRREDADIKELITSVQLEFEMKDRQLRKLQDRCAFLSRERLEVVNRMVVREEEAKLLVQSLRDTVSTLLGASSSSSSPPSTALPNVRHLGSNQTLQGSASASARIPRSEGGGGAFSSPSKGEVKAAVPNSAVMARKRRKRRQAGGQHRIKTCYGSKTVQRVNLWESVWPMPLNCRRAPSKKAALLEETLKYGSIVVAEKVFKGWVRHSLGWTQIKDGNNRFLARLPLVQTPLGMAYLKRKPRMDGLSTIILTWCSGYGVMASLPGSDLVDDILGRAKAKLTKILVSARGELKECHGDSQREELKAHVESLEKKMQELMELSGVETVNELLENLQLDEEGAENDEEGGHPADGGEGDSSLLNPTSGGLATATPRNVITEDGSEGIYGVFSFLLSIVGLEDDSDEEAEGY